MTHNTDAEREKFEAMRAEFEALATSEDYSIRRGFGKQNDYDFVETRRMWFAWQAARRAPAVPVPEGWKLVPVIPTDEMVDAACQDGINLNGRPVWKHTYDVQATWRWQRMIAAAPQPPEAAPDCLTCNDHGAVGNILNAEPCPDCTMKRGTGCSVSNGETKTAPVQLPEPVANLWQHGETGRTRVVMPDAITDCDARWQHVGALYTEQQVRALLAANGIGKEKP